MSSVSESRSKRKRKLEKKKMKKASVSVWSEEDDISLLKAMIDYEVLNHSSPYADMGKFLHFVNPSLHFDVHRKQLTDRLWRLKNRFLNSNYILSKPHHANLFELSKSINSWGHHANSVVVGHVDKSSKNNEKGSDGRNGENDNVAAISDVVGGLELVKKKRKLVSSTDAQNVKEVDVVVISDGPKNTVLVDDVYGTKCSKLVKDKKKKKVVISNNQNVEDDNVAGDDVQSAQKNGKRRVEVLGNQNVPREVDRQDLEYIMSKYPNLTNMLELETLSRMPQHITKRCVIDTIKYMGRGKANKLEEKCADLRLMELELHAMKLDLTNKQIKLILEVARR